MLVSAILVRPARKSARSRGVKRYSRRMLIGYARVSTIEQDLTVQRDALMAFGVEKRNIHVDHGLTGTNRARPGLREALAACREGDTFVVSKLDRLARSLPDARDIADELAAKGVRLSLGGSLYDPTDPVGRLLGLRPPTSMTYSMQTSTSEPCRRVEKFPHRRPTGLSRSGSRLQATLRLRLPLDGSASRAAPTSRSRSPLAQPFPKRGSVRSQFSTPADSLGLDPSMPNVPRPPRFQSISIGVPLTARCSCKSHSHLLPI